MNYLQRDKRWASTPMGFGTGTIGDFGCYLTSLASGLSNLGWDIDPLRLNQILQNKGLWIGEFRNYIDVDSLDNKLPEMFISFTKIEPFNNLDDLKKYMNDDYVVLGKVDARGIGGTGTHFVLIDDVVGNNAIIFDPWTGEYQPVYNRYGKLGNILGLRIFKVKKGIINNNEGNMSNVSVDSATYEMLVTKATKYDEILKNGFVTKEEHDRKVSELESQKGQIAKQLEDQKVITQKQVDFVTESMNKTIDQLKARIVELENKPITVKPEPVLKGKMNGYTVTYKVGDKTVMENYTV